MKRKAFISAFAALLAFLVMASIASMALSTHHQREVDTIMFESQIVEQRVKDAPMFFLKAAEDWKMDSHCLGGPGTADRADYLNAAAALMSSEGVEVTVSSHNFGKSGGPAPLQEFVYLDVVFSVSSEHVTRTAVSVHVEERYFHDPITDDFTFGSNTFTVNC